MAVAFDVKDMTRTSEYLPFPEDLEVLSELNGRHELPDIEWLIDSILKHGQLQPVTIRKTANKPVLVAGFSRWRAVSAINSRKLTEKPIRVRCSYTQLTEKQAFLANIEENRVRNQTTPIDDAYNIQRLVNVYQFTEQECSDAYRTSVTWIRERLQLLELTPEAETAVRSGRVKTSAAVAIAKMTKAQQQQALEKPGRIALKDVKPTTPKAPKPMQRDAELMRRITAVLEDVSGILPDEEYGEFVEVDRKLLLSLHNYVEEIRAL